MPFTPAHVLAVVPLRSRLPFLALAIGSMVPDFGYYYPWTPYFYETAHTLVRTLTFCLPVGLFSYYFVLATFKGWSRLLPFKFQVAPAHYSPIWVALGVWMGALTHLFLDSFTHVDGYFVEHSPGFPFRPLQHLSSALGLGILGWLLWKRHGRNLFELSRPQLIFWMSVISFALIFGLLRYWSPEHAGLSGQRGVFILITSCVSAAISFVSISSAALTIFNSDGRPSNASTGN